MYHKSARSTSDKPQEVTWKVCKSENKKQVKLKLNKLEEEDDEEEEK